MKPLLVSPILLGCLLVPGSVTAQTVSTLAASRQVADEHEMSVNVKFGIGDVRITRDHGSALYRLDLQFDETNFVPVHRYDVSSRTLDVGLEGRAKLKDLDDLDQQLTLSLSPSVPTSFALEFGAGNANVDLGGMTIRSAKIRTGASETEIEFSRPTLAPCEVFDVDVGAAQFRAVGLGNSNCEQISVSGGAGSITLDFSGEWQQRGETNANVTLGLGSLGLRFPSHLGVTIRASRFLASLDLPGFERRGDQYISENYEQAGASLNLELKAIVADVNVVWIPR